MNIIWVESSKPIDLSQRQTDSPLQQPLAYCNSAPISSYNAAMLDMNEPNVDGRAAEQPLHHSESRKHMSEVAYIERSGFPAVDNT